MIYAIIFSFLFLSAMVHDVHRIRVGRRITYLVSYALLVALAGFRFKVGGDTYNYMYYFDILPSLGDIFDTEVGIAKFQPLWLLMVAIAKSIHEDFFVFQIFHALFLNYAVFSFFWKFSRNPHSAVLFYYFALFPYFNFEILRESLAIACFLFAVPAYAKKAWTTYFLFCTIAILFHISALILFFLPLLRNRTFKKRYVLPLFLICWVLNPLFIYLILSFQVPLIFDFVLGYTENSYTLFGLIGIFIFWILVPLSILTLYELLFRGKQEFWNFPQIGLFFCSLIPLFYIFFRFYNYFSIFFVALASSIFVFVISSRRIRRISIITSPLAVSLCFIFFNFRYLGDTSDLAQGTRWYNHWVPYYSIFNPVSDDNRDRLVQAAYDEATR